MFVSDDDEPIPRDALVIADGAVMDRDGREVGRVIQTNTEMHSRTIKILIEVPSPLAQVMVDPRPAAPGRGFNSIYAPWRP